MERNLTTGSIWKSIAFFSLPYLFSYFLQTLYGMADLFIVGQFNGTDAITAVSIGSQVLHMLTVVIVGLAMGSTVMIGQAYGAGDRKKVSDSIGNTITLFTGVAVLLTVILVFSVSGIVSVMSTPAEAVDFTATYLTICFLGIPFITAYNLISAIYRGLGDSKSPMYFIIVACIANIALDYLFIGVLSMGPAGAALGTTLAQAISVVIALIFIRKKKGAFDLSRKNLKPRMPVLGPILKVGFPVALQDGFVQIAFLLITIIANRRGLTDAAAVGIVEKIISFIFLVPSTMLSTVSALSAQNIGAGNYDRAVEILKRSMLICVIFGLSVSLIIQFTAENVVGLFDSSPGVVLAGGQYLRAYVWDCIFAGMHFCFSGFFCAANRSGYSFIQNFVSIIFVRIPGAYLMSEMFPNTLFPMGLAAPAGSFLSVIVCLILFRRLRRREPQFAGEVARD